MNEALDESWVRVCGIDDLAMRRALRVDARGIPIAVFRASHGAVLAVVDRCPHKGGPLSEGIMGDDCVTCPLHGWKISLVTGMAQAPDKGRARTLPVLTRGNDVWVSLADIDEPLVIIQDVTGVHPDTKRPKLGRRRAMPEDFSVHELDRPIPVLAVEPPSPDTETSLRLELTGPQGGRDVFAIDDLKKRFEVVTVPTHLACLMFGFTRAVTWTGVRLRDVLMGSALAPRPFYSFYSWDTDATREKERFFETLPSKYTTDPRTLLVFGMNDERLPKEHGGPLRLVVPFLQGYKSVKWLTWIKATDEDEVGYKKLHGFIEFPEMAPPKGWTPLR